MILMNANPKRALITGVAGFCGQYLVTLLTQHGYRVAGLDIRPYQVPDVQSFTGELCDTDLIYHILNTVQPSHIFHLAAITNSSVGLEKLFHVNVYGTQTLLKAVRNTQQHPTILIAGSSAAYGRVTPNELPIRETQPFRPLTPYAVSKIAQEMIGYQYYAAHGIHVLCTRTFNLTGPGESEIFATSAFARQIVEIETGQREPVLHVGNLDSVRDFTDVRDAMRAYLLLAEHGIPGTVYNVCSGVGTRIRQILEQLVALSTHVGIKSQLDPLRVQPADVPIQIGSAAHLHTLTDWVPTLPLQETLNDVLNFWRKRIYKESP